MEDSPIYPLITCLKLAVRPGHDSNSFMRLFPGVALFSPKATPRQEEMDGLKDSPSNSHVSVVCHAAQVEVGASEASPQ